MRKAKITLIVLILILELQLIVPRLLTGSFASNNWDISQKQDGSVMASLSDDGILTITGTGMMKDWASNDVSGDWHADDLRDKIYKVTIGEGITNVGDNAFENCQLLNEMTLSSTISKVTEDSFKSILSLETVSVSSNNLSLSSENGVLFNKDKTKLIKYPEAKKDLTYTIPDTVTSLENYSFLSANHLNTLTLSNNLKTIGDYTFDFCSNIAQINIPAGVTTIGKGAFSNCSKITNIVLSNTVTQIGDNAFESCLKLTAIDLPDNIINLGNKTFSDCISLATIDFPANLQTIGDSAFYNCKSLTQINIPGNVYSIGQSAFCYCSNITNISLPNGIKILKEKTFYSCVSLLEITLPSELTTIEDDVFYNCNKITSITIPEKVSEIGKNVLSLCSSLSQITVNTNNQNFMDIDGVLYSKDKKRLIRYPSSKAGTDYIITYGAEKIDSTSFQGNTNLKNIRVPNTSLTIGELAFNGCDSLASIIIPNNVIGIYNNSFDTPNTNLVIKCKTDSVAYKYAVDNSIKYETDDIAPIINFSNTGNTTVSKTASTAVNVTDSNFGLDDETLRYEWSVFDSDIDSTMINTKLTNEETVTSNDDLTGTYYLWVHAEDLVGNIINERTDGFILDNAKPNLNVNYNHYYAKVTAIITADEPVKPVTGWTLSEDNLKLTKEYTKNAEENVEVSDLVGNIGTIVVTVDQLETIPPVLSVNYSTTKPTSQNVTATITSNEPIQIVGGWTRSDDKLTLTKEYTANIQETVTVMDLCDNSTNINISINNIDKTAPTVEVYYSEMQKTNKDVTVTIQSNKDVEAISTWNLESDGKTLTKIYTNNIQEIVKVQDKLGNENDVTITIDNIDKVAPTAIITYSKNADNVLVEITLDEPVNPIPGWDISENLMKISTTYTENKTETVSIQDYAGNITNVIVKVTSIGQVVGDVNGNGGIDLNDILMLLRHIAVTNNAGILEKHPAWKLTEIQISAGDINKNGGIDLNDVLKLQRYIAATNSTEIAIKYPSWLEI